MNVRQANRLLKVAQALREAEHPEQFTMDSYVNDCGTPACALGHYAARGDLQKSFLLRTKPGGYGHPMGVYSSARPIGYSINYSEWEIQDHFGISWEEARDLFGGWGCDEAQTPIQAARYIEKFVKSKGFDIKEVA